MPSKRLLLLHRLTLQQHGLLLLLLRLLAILFYFSIFSGRANLREETLFL